MSSIPETAAELVQAWLGLNPDHQSLPEILEESEDLHQKIARLRKTLKEQE
jgi:hypothetical protein